MFSVAFLLWTLRPLYQTFWGVGFCSLHPCPLVLVASFTSQICSSTILVLLVTAWSWKWRYGTCVVTQKDITYIMSQITPGLIWWPFTGCERSPLPQPKNENYVSSAAQKSTSEPSWNLEQRLSSKPKKFPMMPQTNREKPNRPGNSFPLPSAASLFLLTSKKGCGSAQMYVLGESSSDSWMPKGGWISLKNWVNREACPLCLHAHSPYVTCRAGHIPSSSPFCKSFSTVQQSAHGLKARMGPLDPTSRQCS